MHRLLLTLPILLVSCSQPGIDLSGRWMLEDKTQVSLPYSQLPRQKRLTLQRSFTSPFKVSGRLLALYLGEINCDDRVYINGHLVGETRGENGIFIIQRKRRYMFSSNLLAESNVVKIELTCQQHPEFKHNRLYIDDSRAVLLAQNRRLFIQTTISTITILIGVFFIIFFFILSLNRENLFFGILAILLGIYSFFYHETKFLLNLDVVLTKQVEYGLLFILPTFYLWFILDLVKVRKKRIWYTISLSGLLLVPAVFFITDPVTLNFLRRLWQGYFILLFVAGVYIHFASRHQLKQGSKYVIAAYSILMVFAMFELARTFSLHKYGRQVYIGILAFSVFMALALVAKLRHIQSMVARLSERQKKQRNVLRRAVNIKTLQLQEQSRQLLKLSEEQRNFFIRLSHDLRTPLSMLTIPIETLLKDIEHTNENQWHKLSKIKTNTYKILGMLNDLLDIARLREQKHELQLVTADIAAYTRNIARDFSELASAFKSELEIQCHPVSFLMAFDAEKFQKILINLLSNALKFNRPGEKIVVETRVKDSFFILSVTDHGEGIAAEKINEIFKPYHQAAINQSANSTGLGLAIVKEFAELHGGRIEVQSETKAFSTFSVFLPSRKAEEKAVVPEKSQRTYEMLETLESRVTAGPVQREEHLRVYSQPGEHLDSLRELVQSFKNAVVTEDFTFKKADIHIVISPLLPEGVMTKLKRWPKPDHVIRILITQPARQLAFYEKLFDAILLIPFSPQEVEHTIERLQNQADLRGRYRRVLQQNRLYHKLAMQLRGNPGRSSIGNWQLKRLGSDMLVLTHFEETEEAETMLLMAFDQNSRDFAPLIKAYLAMKPASFDTLPQLVQLFAHDLLSHASCFSFTHRQTGLAINTAGAGYVLTQDAGEMPRQAGHGEYQCHQEQHRRFFFVSAPYLQLTEKEVATYCNEQKAITGGNVFILERQ